MTKTMTKMLDSDDLRRGQGYNNRTRRTSEQPMQQNKQRRTGQQSSPGSSDMNGTSGSAVSDDSSRLFFLDVDSDSESLSDEEEMLTCTQETSLSLSTSDCSPASEL